MSSDWSEYHGVVVRSIVIKLSNSTLWGCVRVKTINKMWYCDTPSLAGQGQECHFFIYFNGIDGGPGLFWDKFFFCSWSIKKRVGGNTISYEWYREHMLQSYKLRASLNCLQNKYWIICCLGWSHSSFCDDLHPGVVGGVVNSDNLVGGRSQVQEEGPWILIIRLLVL